MGGCTIQFNRSAPFCLILFFSLLAGCERNDASSSQATDPVKESPKPPRAILSFPQSLHTDDATVNEFVTHAMTTCANGDYDSFRLLWSAREEPLNRQEYERGWKAVQQVTIRALQQVRLAPDKKKGETESRMVYGVFADVQLDPEQTPEPMETERRVVLVLIREHDHWRLARAPRSLRKWLTEKVRPTDPTPLPPDDDLDIPTAHQGS